MILSTVQQVIEDAKDGTDLWYAFIIGLPALVAAVATLYGQHKAKARWDAQEERSNTIVAEVKNSHQENLRDEITRGFREVREDIKIIREEHRQMREELHTERQERIDGDQRRCENFKEAS